MSHLRIEWSEGDSCLRNITESQPGVISIANGRDEVFFFADPHLNVDQRKGPVEQLGQEGPEPEKLGTPAEVFAACEPDVALRLYGIVAQSFARTVQLGLTQDHLGMIANGFEFLVACREALADKLAE